MGKVKYFDSESQQNHERLRKHRLKKRFKLNHENHVRERIQFLDDIEIVDSTGKNQRQLRFDESIDVFHFTDRLKHWAVHHRITARAISDLLKILILAGFSFLPKDSRTFLHTPTKLSIKVLEKGKLWYNGLKKCIDHAFSNVNRAMEITLDFNFDGLPVFKSSNLQFWPILAAIKGYYLQIFLRTTVIK